MVSTLFSICVQHSIFTACTLAVMCTLYSSSSMYLYLCDYFFLSTLVHVVCLSVLLLPRIFLPLRIARSPSQLELRRTIQYPYFVRAHLLRLCFTCLLFHRRFPVVAEDQNRGRWAPNSSLFCGIEHYDDP